MSWYRTGTVAVTNGSKTVTGVGTLWTTSVNVGDAFALVDANLNPTGAWYEVDVVVSNAEITLKQSYAGTTGSNNQYCVFNMVGNMTTPSFAQRLATFFASFQSLIDKPTVTPTAASIPVADANGKIDSGWIPATFFNKTNILGTVSQVGGVPTGAVIERGSNANGEYVKFADGTMISYSEATVVGGVPAAYGAVFGSAATDYVLPVAFVGGHSCFARDASSIAAWAVLSSTQLRLFSYTSAITSDRTVRIVTIGKWL